MSKIIIRTAAATPRQVKRKDGTVMVFREQAAAVMKDGEDFAHPFRLSLDDTQAPYPAGEYVVDASSFNVGQYGDLMVSRRIVLVPIAPAPAPAPAK
ncbi:single-stranded DNA-binding protein [Stenotrophomonas lactitubi]|uniref:single-stranded DNA-binding protein n=1 Tax=Stenotrophomonas lactitubi TaxID=2045214 RepID=UPI0035C1D020